MDTRPGRVRDRATRAVTDWLGLLEAAIRQAQKEGDIAGSEDAGQLAFELHAYLLLANTQFVSSHEARPIQRARRAISRRLAAAR